MANNVRRHTLHVLADSQAIALSGKGHQPPEGITGEGSRSITNDVALAASAAPSGVIVVVH